MSPKEELLEVFYRLVFYITPLVSSRGSVVLVTVVMYHDLYNVPEKACCGSLQDRPQS